MEQEPKILGIPRGSFLNLLLAAAGIVCSFLFGYVGPFIGLALSVFALVRILRERRQEANNFNLICYLLSIVAISMNCVAIASFIIVAALGFRLVM